MRKIDNAVLVDADCAQAPLIHGTAKRRVNIHINSTETQGLQLTAFDHVEHMATLLHVLMQVGHHLSITTIVLTLLIISTKLGQLLGNGPPGWTRHASEQIVGEGHTPS
jgi:hypothetical protein